MTKEAAGAQMRAYAEDLAYIHDVGFGDFARAAAPGVLEILRRAGVTGGLVVDLGCGSGIWARQLVDAGYDVLGIDISAALVERARERVPEGKFLRASFFDAELPPANAVTSLGECLGYLFDESHGEEALARLFERVHRSLAPGGVFVFDVLLTGYATERPRRSFAEGEDWAVLVENEEDAERRELTRHITSFRQVGDLYRRAEEVHRLRLFDEKELAAALGHAGFRVRTLRSYGRYRFARAGHLGFIARKDAG